MATFELTDEQYRVIMRTIDDQQHDLIFKRNRAAERGHARREQQAEDKLDRLMDTMRELKTQYMDQQSTDEYEWSNR